MRPTQHRHHPASPLAPLLQSLVALGLTIFGLATLSAEPSLCGYSILSYYNIPANSVKRIFLPLAELGAAVHDKQVAAVFGRHNESNDIPAQNGDGLAVGGDHAVAPHDAEIGRMILDRFGARRQISDLDELNVDARMRCFGDRSESRDEAIGRTARRPDRDAEIGVRRPEIDSRNKRCRDGQNTCSHKFRRAQGTISANLSSCTGPKAFFMSVQTSVSPHQPKRRAPHSRRRCQQRRAFSISGSDSLSHTVYKAGADAATFLRLMQTWTPDIS